MKFYRMLMKEQSMSKSFETNFAERTHQESRQPECKVLAKYRFNTMEQEMKRIIVNNILIPSLFTLYKVDYDNIRFGASERNICARLAHHMENIMREYDQSHDVHLFDHFFVDVEYNRMGNGDLKHYENSEHRPTYMVSDLLIQARGYERNLLAVEMKRKGNNRNVREDRERLISLVSSSNVEYDIRCVHDTLVGAFIVYSPDRVKLDLYESILGKGNQTRSYNLLYQQEENGGGRLYEESSMILQY